MERMGESEQSEGTGRFQHLHDALDADDPCEKDYHIRQALQLVNIEDIDE